MRAGEARRSGVGACEGRHVSDAGPISLKISYFFFFACAQDPPSYHKGKAVPDPAHRSNVGTDPVHRSNFGLVRRIWATDVRPMAGQKNAQKARSELTGDESDVNYM